MLEKLSQKSPKPCIFKVPNYLRQVKEMAYAPQVIGIGPYHRGNEDRLKAMEELKIRFLQKLIEETKETDISRYVLKMRELEERARKCYAEPVSLESNDFITMLVLDGCFIVQLIRLFLKSNLKAFFHDVLNCYTFSGSFSLALCRDILLVENQLPFFVLWELFSMIESGDNLPAANKKKKKVQIMGLSKVTKKKSSADDYKEKFLETIFDLFCQCMPGKGRPKGDLKFKEIEIRHLLDFIHRCCCHPSSFEMKSYGKNKNLDWKFIRCATELQEAGITFKKVDGKSMFDIKFENGTLQIPELKIGDHTEPLLRNLIAFEQLFLSDMHLFHSDNSLKHVTDYMVFLNHLIDSPKDVEILCQNGIIKHTLGDDEAVATMINSLGAFVIYSDSFYSSNFYYAMVFNQINDYCSRRWNKRMANLKHNYFNSPWALISFLAALLLLILTVLQSVFSVLSYAG
ncbi:hypothetical protein CCACVL1_28932 [Corchorus capsularis]|uniref:Uncharacterized protein n=1 Tax=Corchorus capsularis TaxID=210143 RepID=A0A1R3G4Q6_COCAP|nr:hypothetical protein CCACVL1_28932 [Corchorus capsularis]